MMQQNSVYNPWDAKTKRSSGLFSVLKWFGNNSKETSVPPDLIHTPSSSCESIESVFSTDTVASFAFVPPNKYRPFGNASQAEKFIQSGPESNTYRARLAQRDIRRESDKNLTLRSKYNLYKSEDNNKQDERGHSSLPLMTKFNNTSDLQEENKMHRRTASESSKVRKVGAYCHVKGKRRAPQPPNLKGDSILRRKKRMAPQPPLTNPDIISNDSLKLDHGILKPARDSIASNRTSILLQNSNSSTQINNTNSPGPSECSAYVSPRPWYKRTLSKSASAQEKPKVEAQEKRKSGMSFLTNISELDREAMEIVNKETLKLKYLKNSPQAPLFMRPKTESPNSDSWISPRRKSARDLIAKFNAITGVSKLKDPNNLKEKSLTPPIKESIPEFVIPVTREKTSPQKVTIKENAPPKSPIIRTTAVVKPISRSQWNCPKCTLENDYWRIICRVCSTIKPYFDDFTTPSSPTQPETNKITTEDSIKIDQTDNYFDFRITDLQKSLFQSNYPKVSILNPDNVKPKLETVFHFQVQNPATSQNNFKTPYPKLDPNMNKETSTDKIEKMILGDELSYTDAKSKINDDKQKTKKKLEEKMILGDVINITKQEIKTESTTNDCSKNNPIQHKIERMILGDEISVTKQKKDKPNNNEVVTKQKISKQEEESKKISDAKREETEKLKKLLIEMKNSLPKRNVKLETTNINNQNKKRVSLIQEQPETIETNEPPSSASTKQEQKQEEDDIKTIELITATVETCYENIFVKKSEGAEENKKPIKVSSSAQTNAVYRRNLTAEERQEIMETPAGYQLIGAKDFVGISNEKIGKNDDHTYANLNSNNDEKLIEASVSKLNINDNKNKIKPRENIPAYPGCSKNDTLEINKLLRKLENSIANGQLGEASVFARELAQLKVPLNVIRQRSSEANDKNKNIHQFSVDMYVEDKMSHRGPFSLQVSEFMTVLELKLLVEDKYKIPKAVQRWILGKELATNDKTTLGEHQIKTSGCPIFLYLVAPSDKKTEQTEKVEITEVSESHIQNTNWPIDKVYNVPIAIIEEDVEDDGTISDDENDLKILALNFEENNQNLWKCKACTLLNPVSNIQCEVCGLIRDEKENTEENGETKKYNETYIQLMNLDNEDLVPSLEGFECIICFGKCLPGKGVTLRECLHQFCRECLAHTVEFSEEAEVKCPYRDQQYACDIALQDREVKALVSPLIYEQHLAKSVKQAENKMGNTFHCKTPDCKGWCIYEDNVNDFYCPVCQKTNCLTCQAIHTGRNCKQYQEQMKSQSETDEDARRTRDFLEDMIKRGEALACPTCQVVLLKKWGCDWVRCSMCKTEICWVTKGPRWGLGGRGDTSGGCKCGLNGIKCHPKCNYCH